MIAIAVLFILLGILIKYGKMYFLLAGYNTMTQEEKEKYDIERLASLFRNVLFGMAALIIIGYLLWKWTGVLGYQTYFTFGALILGVPYLLIKSNTKAYKTDKD
jgi:hypothetical protein